MKPKELEQKESLLDREIQFLEERIEKFELETRGEIDRLRLEFKAIEWFLETQTPDFKKQFQKIREEVFQNLNPEK